MIAIQLAVGVSIIVNQFIYIYIGRFVMDDQEKPSKTQRKKDMIFLQKLGETLIGLSKSQIAKIALPENLLEAIHAAHALKSNEAKRRQLQYIGRLMRDIDPQPIQVALNNICIKHEVSTSQFHHIEEWRDRLIVGGDQTVQTFLEMYPQTDRQHLRLLVRKSQHDREHDKNTGGETELFKYLRSCLS